MASISTMWAQTLKFVTTYTFQTVDADGTNTRTMFTGASTSAPKYLRVLIAPSGGAAASETDCQDLLLAFETALNTSTPGRYTVAISSTGYIQVTYNGSGTSTLTWGSSGSNAVRSVLGFSAGWTSLASGATTTAANQPSHVVYSFSCGEDTGWTTQSVAQAIGEKGDGTVYGWSDFRQLVVRSFTLRYHPRTASDRASLGSTPITPAFPSTHDRMANPSGSLIAGAPWSVHELIQTAISDGTYSGRVGLALGTFQDLVNGVSTTCDEVFFRAKSRMQDKSIVPTVKNWSRLCDVGNVEILRAATITVSP